MSKKLFRVGLASLFWPRSIPEGVEKVEATLEQCKERKVQIVCFPETYIPGLRGGSFDLQSPDQAKQEWALQRIRQSCRKNSVGAIVGMEWMAELGLENRAMVISPSGRLLGHQTKNQITPGGEEENYVADGKRRLFRIAHLTFGIVICHEGWRYPETVRWAAVRGAKVVFQPQVTGSDKTGTVLKEWGTAFYEKAMECRAQENTVYFCSVNNAMKYQNSATSVIDPKGKLVAWVPYGKEELLVVDLDLSLATRYYAKRFRPDMLPP